MALVEVENLKKSFPISQGPLRPPLHVHAVTGVSFAIERGETLGLVGESGCGKSTLGRCLLRLIEPTSGSVRYEGKEILQMSSSELKHLRRKIQIIFQDPYSSLNPRLSVRQIIEEPLIIHRIGTKMEREKKVEKLIERVGLPGDALKRYPHEFSGGQRQRVGIARALAVEPEFIVCDEPVSALDVSVQAQVINLLMDLQDELNLTYLFIAHDLNVVEHISHRVAVMYLGGIVELGKSTQVCKTPSHPYSQALLSAVPVPVPGEKPSRILLPGDPPRPTQPPPGCVFHPRCRMAVEFCRSHEPRLEYKHERQVSCHEV